jgi:branched-chain amino acid aminotransferase
MIMDTIVSEFYLEDFKTKTSSLINYQFNTQNFLIYEVIRTKNGVTLFLEDHLERMKNSLIKLGLGNKFHESEVKKYLEQLVEKNNNQIGNIKLLCSNFQNELFFAAYYIQHEYPTNLMYKRGIKLITFPIERPDPHLKQVIVSEKIRNTIENTRLKESAYEILLIDQRNCITEGSKSNIFFICNGKLFSPPEEKILQGITRKYVLQIARGVGIKINYIEINLSDISHYDSAFICGTSTKIMPVKSIDNNNFEVKNPVTYLLMNEYNQIIKHYINTTRRK